MAAFDGSRVSKRTGAPADLLSLAEAKEHLRRDDDDENGFISSLISAVSALLDDPDGPVGRALVEQTWTFKDWPPSRRLVLPVSPVISVESIEYFDAAEVQQTLTVSDFHLRANEDEAFLEPKAGISWPAMAALPDAVTVTYKAGYGAAADVPEDLRQASKLLLGHWYENREAVVVGTIATELPIGVDALINKHRRTWISG